MSRSHPEKEGIDPMGKDELSQSQDPMLTSQDTTMARSTDTRVSPTLPPGLFDHVAMRRSECQQSHTVGEPILTPKISRRRDCINRSLHLYEHNLG